MPYEHDTTAMREEEADAVIARVRQSIAARTSDALRRVVIELAPAHTAVALAIREPPFDDLPATVAAVRTSYRLLCAADGMLYQLAICHAARQLELDVHTVPPRQGNGTGCAATRRDTCRNRGVRQSNRPAGRPAVDAGAPAGVRSRHRGAGGARARASQDSSAVKAQPSRRAAAITRITVQSVSAPGLVAGGLRRYARLISRGVPEPGQRQHTTRHRSDIRMPARIGPGHAPLRGSGRTRIPIPPT